MRRQAGVFALFMFCYDTFGISDFAIAPYGNNGAKE